jgi:hypothetical protein
MTAMRVTTSAGELTLLFGINGWLLVERRRGGSVQRQVRDEDDVRRLLEELGLDTAEAGRVAGDVWRRRPADLASTSLTGWEAPWKAAGLRSFGGVLFAIAVCLGGFVLFLLLFWALSS